MEIVGMDQFLTMVFLPLAAVFHLAATLELPFRLFSKTRLFRAGEDSALASRFTCIVAGVAGMFVAKFVVPTSWLDVFLLWALFLSMFALTIGYIKMIVDVVMKTDVGTLIYDPAVDEALARHR